MMIMKTKEIILANSLKMKQLQILLILTVFLAGCGPQNQDQKSQRVADGGVEYGHVFRMNEVRDIRSLHPLNITEVAAFRISTQVYEGLVKFAQKDLKPEPALAEKWEVNDDATEWTFHLREDVYFHDDPCFESGEGREVKAEDVEWCVKQLCTASPSNQMFWLVDGRLKGAREYYNVTLDKQEDLPELEGIEVVDDYTIKFHLNFPSSNFLQLLGHNGFYIYPKEALAEYGDQLGSNAVGTGPFVLKVYKPNELVVLERNNKYWKEDEHGNELPYLDAIQVSFIKDKKSELLKFKNGELDMVFTLPVEMYSEVMADFENAGRNEQIDFIPQVKPSLSIQYYAFQHKSELFSNKDLRKAFNYAIDRQAIVNYGLQGEGEPGTGGIIPPAFKDYPFKKVNGFTFDPVKAKEHLERAGYPNGEGFPELTLELASGGQNYEIVAQIVQKMLEENLNIKVNLQVMSIAQLLDNSESGRSLFWRDSWVADYPDPENFLCLFVSQNHIGSSENDNAYLNSVRYENPLYDSLFARAIREVDPVKRNQMYLELDQILMNDAVVMPLYYEEFTRLIPSYMQNFPQNGIEYRDFTEVWMDSSKMPKKS